jgi:hypothetical protein
MTRLVYVAIELLLFLGLLVYLVGDNQGWWTKDQTVSLVWGLTNLAAAIGSFFVPINKELS